MQDNWQMSAHLLQHHPKGISTSVRFQALTAVLLKIKVVSELMLHHWLMDLWIIMPSSPASGRPNRLELLALLL
jgi:hypothetical protein